MIHEPHATGSLPAEFWQLPKDVLLYELGSGSNGLSQSEAGRRLGIFGANRVEASQTRSIIRKLAHRILNPLVAMLLVAAAVSGVSGDLGSFAIIVAVLSLSLTLDIVQEHRAELTAEALRDSVAIEADVVRGGAEISIPVKALVPGDIVKLRTGDLIPADGIVLESRELQVNEALMTGEPFPAFKTDAPCSAKWPAEATNALFAGTSTVGGSGKMLIVETGSRTRFGAIAAALAANAPPTALEAGVRRLGLLILRLTLFLTLFVLLTHLVAQRPAMESFLFAVALAVGLTPELLPMVMTVTLARGALRMAKRKVIVKRLSSIHDLGAMDTLCVDKTGGAVSSLFEAITFLVLLRVFHADATLFQTGWFVESIASQILVIFLIRSRRMPWRANRPHVILIAASLGALGAGVALALGPWGRLFGFTVPSVTLIAIIITITISYLAAAEAAKRLALSDRQRSSSRATADFFG